MHYLSIENLTKTYADKPLFRNISFNINEGDKIALVALNGTGKSSLLKIITGADVADEGKVWINKDVNVVYLDQDPDLDMEKNVLDNIFQFDHPIINAIRKYEALIDNENPDPQALSDAIKDMD